MSRIKAYINEIERRGYGEVPQKHVCKKCFLDNGLIELIKKNGTRGVCSYCGSKSKTVLDLKSIISHILNSIKTEWIQAEDDAVPYNTQEGGYQIPVFTIPEILEEKEPIDAVPEDLLSDICSAFSDTAFVHSISLNYNEDLVKEGWSSLVEAIKHQSRFVIFNEKVTQIFTKESSIFYEDPRGAIEGIADAIEHLGMVKKLRKSTPIYRARLSRDDKDLNTAKEMGTIPYNLADQANRMSPIGIPMFYGALEQKTARAELGELSTPGFIHYGKFYPSRDLNLIDFTKEQEVPSIYSEKKH